MNLKLVTFSFDDGHPMDKDIIDLIGNRPSTFYLVCDNLQKLSRDWYAKHEVGSHTVHHGHLWRMNRIAIEKELQDSAVTLREWTGRKVRAFAYPRGQTTLSVSILAKTAGYEFARTYAVDPENAYIIPEPFLLPVTGYLDKPINWPLLERMSDEGKPIHLGGHARHFDTKQKLHALDNLIGWFDIKGYNHVTNSEYVMRCLEARGGPPR